MSCPLEARVEDDRISRKPVQTATRWYHGVNLRSRDDLDDQVRAWLTESYLRFG